MPAVLRKAAVVCPTATGSVAGSRLVLISMLVLQCEAWSASSTLGASVSRRWSNAWAKPCTVSG